MTFKTNMARPTSGVTSGVTSGAISPVTSEGVAWTNASAQEQMTVLVADSLKAIRNFRITVVAATRHRSNSAPRTLSHSFRSR